MYNEQISTQNPGIAQAISSDGIYQKYGFNYYFGTPVRMTLTPEGNFSIYTLDSNGNQLTPLVSTTKDRITKVFGRGIGLVVSVDGTNYNISLGKKVNPWMILFSSYLLLFMSRTPQALAEKQKWLQAFSALQQPNIAVAHDRTFKAIGVGLIIGVGLLAMLIAWAVLFYAKPKA